MINTKGISTTSKSHAVTVCVTPKQCCPTVVSQISFNVSEQIAFHQNVASTTLNASGKEKEKSRL